MESVQFSNLSQRQKLARLKRLAHAALKAWPVTIESLRFYGEHSNVLYKVTDTAGRAYVLKIARPGDHDLPEIRASLSWLRYLNNHPDQPLVEVVPAADGTTAVEVQPGFTDEPRFCSLFRWVDGANLSARLTLKNAEAWGRLCAWIHEHASGYTAGGNIGDESSGLMRWDRSFYWDEEVLLSNPAYEKYVRNGRRAVIAKTAAMVDAEIGAFFSAGRRPMLLHGDLHPDNVKITPDGRAIAIDVEDVMWGYAVQDVAVSLFYVRRHPRWEKLLAAYRRGYESLSPWPVESDRLLWALFCGRQLMFANFIVKLNDWSEAEKEEALSNYVESFNEFFERFGE